MATYIGGQGPLLRMYKEGLFTQEEYEGLFELFTKYGPFIFDGNPTYSIDLIPSKFIKEGNLSWIPINMEALRNN